MFNKNSHIVAAFLLPLVLKTSELYLSELSLFDSLIGFSQEFLLLVVLGLGVLVRSLPWLRQVCLYLLCLVDALLIIEFIAYQNFGTFYEFGILDSMPINSTVDMVVGYLTKDIVLSVLFHMLGAWFLAVLILNIPGAALKSVDATVSTTMPLVVLFLCALALQLVYPASTDVQRLPLLVSAASFFSHHEAMPVSDSEVQAMLLSSRSGDHEAKPPVSINDLISPLVNSGRRLNLVVYSMESSRAISSGAYGGLTQSTPFLDEMRDSGQGVFFSHAYGSSPRSIKALLTLLMGIYPRFSREPWSWPMAKDSLRDGRSLPEILNENTYLTTFFVNSLIRFDNRNQLLKALDVNVINSTREFIAKDDSVVVDKLDEFFALADKVHQPLFSMLLASSGHSPFKYPQFPEDNGKIDLSAAQREAQMLGIPAKGNAHQDTYPKYLRSMRHQDDVARMLFEYLKENNRLHDTVFVVLGDHGETFGEHGGRGGVRGHGLSLYEESIRVPMWIYHPQLPARVIDAPFAFLDFVPTVLALLGIDTEIEFLGRNVFEQPRQRLYFTNFMKWPALAVLQYPYKLIKYGLAGDDVDYELFNVVDDPRETKNLYVDEKSIDQGNYTYKISKALKAALAEAGQFIPAYEAEYGRLARLEYQAGLHAPGITPLPTKSLVSGEADIVVPLDVAMDVVTDVAITLNTNSQKQSLDAATILEADTQNYFPRPGGIQLKFSCDCAKPPKVKIYYREKADFSEVNSMVYVPEKQADKYSILMPYKFKHLNTQALKLIAFEGGAPFSVNELSIF